MKDDMLDSLLSDPLWFGDYPCTHPDPEKQ